jgi:hypothetical protein
MRKSGQVPAQQMVVISLDWRLGAFFPRVVIPDDRQIQQTDLSFIAGLWALIAYRQIQAHRVNELTQHALQFHPNALHALNVDKACVTFVKLGLDSWVAA